MASTNKTAHYGLSQFLATDKPSWMGDVNADMLKIDTAIFTAQTAATGAAGDASGALTAAQNAQTAAEAAQTAATGAMTAASNAQTTANEAKTDAATAQTAAEGAQATGTNALNTANGANTTAIQANTDIAAMTRVDYQAQITPETGVTLTGINLLQYSTKAPYAVGYLHVTSPVTIPTNDVNVVTLGTFNPPAVSGYDGGGGIGFTLINNQPWPVMVAFYKNGDVSFGRMKGMTYPSTAGIGVWFEGVML